MILEVAILNVRQGQTASTSRFRSLSISAKYRYYPSPAITVEQRPVLESALNLFSE